MGRRTGLCRRDLAFAGGHGSDAKWRLARALMPVEPERVPIGAEAPNFSLESPCRGTVRLADYRDRDQVILVFMRSFG